MMAKETLGMQGSSPNNSIVGTKQIVPSMSFMTSKAVVWHSNCEKLGLMA